LGGVLIVTFRNSIAKFRLFSLPDLYPASCIRERSDVGGQASIATETVAPLLFCGKVSKRSFI